MKTRLVICILMLAAAQGPVHPDIQKDGYILREPDPANTHGLSRDDWDELCVLACNAVHTDQEIAMTQFFRKMTFHKLKIEDIYFDIVCSYGAWSMLHSAASFTNIDYFLRVLKAYDRRDGTHVLDTILNAVYGNAMFSQAPDQTVVDYMEDMSNRFDEAYWKTFYAQMRDLYISYGGKRLSGLVKR